MEQQRLYFEISRRCGEQKAACDAQQLGQFSRGERVLSATPLLKHQHTYTQRHTHAQKHTDAQITHDGP